VPSALARAQADPPSSLVTHHSSLLQIQRGDVDLVDVAQSVARTVQLLQELFVAQPFFQWLVCKAAVAGEEKPFPVRLDFRREIPNPRINLVAPVRGLRPDALTPIAHI